MLPLGFIYETWAASTRRCREFCLGNTSANAIAKYITIVQGQVHLSLTSLAVSTELAPNRLGGLSIQLEGAHAVLMLDFRIGGFQRVCGGPCAWWVLV
jgi:hypothetical protein